MQDEGFSELQPLPPLPPCALIPASVPPLRGKSAAHDSHDGAETFSLSSTRAPRRTSRKAAPPPPPPPPLQVPVPFKAATLARADVRAHLVCEAAAHALYMQQQLPMPWPKCAEWHAVALAERAADATTRLPGARRRGMTSGPPRHLALAAAAATQLFQALHAVFACADPGAIASGGGGGGISPERLALVFGPSPRRAQWVVLLDFSACGPPSAAVPSNGALMDADLTSKSGSSGSSRNKGGPGLSTEEDRMLDACGRRLKRTLLEVAMQTPPARGGIPGGVATRASKLHVLFQFAPPSGGGRRELVGSGGSRGGEGPAAEVLAPRENSTVGPGFSGGFGFNFNDAAVMLPRSRLPAALLRAVDALQLPPPVGAAAAAAAAAATRPVRSKRPAKGWPAAPWLLRFGKDSAHRASASAAPPSPTSMAATPPPPGSLSSMSSSGSRCVGQNVLLKVAARSPRRALH